MPAQQINTIYVEPMPCQIERLLFMENLASFGYNDLMPTPLPNIDLAALCLDLEKDLNYSPFEMAERLGITLKAYQRWRSGDREPSGQPAIKLSLLVREVEAKTGKKFLFKLKEL